MFIQSQVVYGIFLSFGEFGKRLGASIRYFSHMCRRWELRWHSCCQDLTYRNSWSILWCRCGYWKSRRIRRHILYVEYGISGCGDDRLITSFGG